MKNSKVAKTITAKPPMTTQAYNCPQRGSLVFIRRKRRVAHPQKIRLQILTSTGLQSQACQHIRHKKETKEKKKERIELKAPWRTSSTKALQTNE